MLVDNENGVVVFDRLISAKRELGSEDTLKVTKIAPASKPIAPNAKGVFAERDLQQIHDSAQESARKLKELFSGS